MRRTDADNRASRRFVSPETEQNFPDYRNRRGAFHRRGNGSGCVDDLLDFVIGDLKWRGVEKSLKGELKKVKIKLKYLNIDFALYALIIGLFLALSQTAQAATYTVTKTADTNDTVCDADCSLREAIAAANSTPADDNIEFDTAVFNSPQTITLAGAELAIESNGTLTINSAGVSGITVSGGDGTTNTNRVFFIFSNSGPGAATINKLTIRNGRAFGGGGIAMRNVVLRLTNSTVSDNTSFGDGGGIFGGGFLAGNNVTVSGNTASGNGGGIYNSNYPYTLENSIVSNNTATNGGGIYEEESLSFSLNNLTVSGNTATGNGGGMWTTGNYSGRPVFSNLNVSNNSAGGDGGGIFSSYLGLALDLCTISGNSAADDGGGIYQENFGDPNQLDRSTVSGNTAGGDGGGVFVNSIFQASNSTVSGNTAGGNGGGLAGDVSFSPMMLLSSTVSGNTATGKGGGIFSLYSAVLLNTTVSGNAAQTDGGGMFLAGYQSSVSDSTFSGNSAARGGGIFSDFADPNNGLGLQNTIIANSAAGGDCFRQSGTVDAYYNLIEDVLGCINGANFYNLTGDPNLGPLANNGGATQTHTLLPGSIAIDAGYSTNTTDQRSLMRPVDLTGYPNTSNGADIGAFEVQAPTAASVSIGGRVLVGKGSNLRNAIVTLTDSSGATRTARTSSFGYYRFDGIAAGQTVIITVVSKRFTFAPRVVSVAEDIAELDFYSEALE